MCNVNKETGIRYGVIQGTHADLLMDEIVSNGTDESFEAYKADLVKQMSSLLEEHGQRNPDRTAAEIVDNYEWDDYECDEPNYSYKDSEGNEFLLSYLGGAPMIWVTKSNLVVTVKSLCSPCVPNAGDLDSGQCAEGFECYGIPLSYLETSGV
jgi:hypothetical protein